MVISKSLAALVIAAVLLQTASALSRTDPQVDSKCIMIKSNLVDMVTTEAMAPASPSSLTDNSSNGRSNLQVLVSVQKITVILAYLQIVHLVTVG